MHSVAANPSATTAQYAVPRRFGMAGILAITTLMAVLFGLLRYCNAHPAAYMFVGLLSLVTCLVQMRYGEVPRVASLIAGAIFMPLCALGTFLFAVYEKHVVLDDIGWLVFMLPLLLSFGAFFGYLAGACTAGLFLLMDLIEPHLPGGGGSGPRYARPAKSRHDEIVMATLVHPNEGMIQGMISENPFVPEQFESNKPFPVQPENPSDV